MFRIFLQEIFVIQDCHFYGDMTGLATNIREQVNIQILREHYLPQHAIGVVGFLEADSKVCNEQKIAELVMAAA